MAGGHLHDEGEAKDEKEEEEKEEEEAEEAECVGRL